MGKSKAELRRVDRQLAAEVARELAALSAMSTAELAAKWEALTGQPARSHNAANLRKRLAWRVQELALGGLSEAALARIEELAPPAANLTTEARLTTKRRGGATPLVHGRPKRDPRLPEPGAVLRREYNGAGHEVTVLAYGFEFRGERYRSLSKVARQITGTAWNGFLFFGLTGRQGRAGKQEAA